MTNQEVLSARGDYARSEPSRLEPRYYEPKLKDRKPRPDDYESDRRPDRTRLRFKFSTLLFV